MSIYYSISDLDSELRGLFYCDDNEFHELSRFGSDLFGGHYKNIITNGPIFSTKFDLLGLLRRGHFHFPPSPEYSKI